MAAPSSAPSTRSKRLTQPKIHETAYVHSFSSVTGEVEIGAEVLVAPGTSIRAEAGSSFRIEQGSNIQEGVVIHGLEQGRVLGDNERPYSVWIGRNTTITHMALIQGPAYIGDGCFIGFRSTVFNARIGDGCIVMLHVLIQDVEVPPGKFVPSGSVITTQQQADQLPDVKASDLQFVTHVVGMNQALRSGYHRAETVTRVAPIRQTLERAYQRDVSAASNSSSSSYSTPMQHTHLAPEVVERVRQLLSQGLRIGMEHADARRFQTSSWHSCTPIGSTREADVLAGLANCVAEHPGEYVRLFGIDTKSKRRVSELIVQRPGGSQPSQAAHSGSYSAPSRSHSSRSHSHNGSASSGDRLGSEIAEQVRYLLSQGYHIGTEHADTRHFRTSSWYSCAPIAATRQTDAMAALEGCLAEHQGEYVRMFGIDTKSKRRISEVIIQRPGDSSNGVRSHPSTAGYAAPSAQSKYQSQSGYQSQSKHQSQSGGRSSAASGALNREAVDQVRSLLRQGYRVAAEHADARRFQTSSWKTCAPIQTSNESGVLAALESCLSENRGEYVRLYGVDTKTKRRVAELIIQRP